MYFFSAISLAFCSLDCRQLNDNSHTLLLSLLLLGLLLFFVFQQQPRLLRGEEDFEDPVLLHPIPAIKFRKLNIELLELLFSIGKLLEFAKHDVEFHKLPRKIINHPLVTDLNAAISELMMNVVQFFSFVLSYKQWQKLAGTLDSFQELLLWSISISFFF
jgi:hypothetical protein